MIALFLGLLAVTPPTPGLRLPAGAHPLRYSADVAVDPALATFTATADVDVAFDKASPFLWLNAQKLTIASATLSAAGKTVPVRVVSTTAGFAGFAFDTPAEGPATLHVEYSGVIDPNETSGLFGREADGRKYAFTQFEELGARRVFPCFDEPGFKTPWTITLRVPKALVAISNTKIASEKTEGALRIVRFEQTRPLPSYLVAFAVGPFAMVDAGTIGRSKTPIRLAALAGRAREAKPIAQAISEIIPALEAWFDRPFPYEKLDIVAIPHFPGAMENAGMITADSDAFPREGEYDAGAQRRVVTLFAHEIAHQWFGDLVTMAWWDDIWLNESFASYLEPVIAGGMHPEWKVAEEFLPERSSAMSGDLGVHARSVRQPIESNDDILNAFDSITYIKGEAILRMFASALGPDVFKRGARRYIAAHLDGSATTADFVSALSAEAGRDLAPDFSSFLDKTGVPLVTASLSCPAGGSASLHLTQKRLLALGSSGHEDATWRIPLCIRVWHGDASVRSCETLTAAEQSLPLTGACPDRVLVNDGSESWARVSYEGDLGEKLIGKFTSLPIADRFALTDDAASLFEAGRIPAAGALSFVPLAASDRDARLQRAAMGIARYLDDAELVTPERRGAYERWVRRVFADRAHGIGWAPRSGESGDDTLLRPGLVVLVANRGNDGALIAEALRLARKLATDRTAVDVSMREVVLYTAARHGDARLFDILETASHAAKDEREQLLFSNALFWFRDPMLFQRALATLEDPKLPGFLQLPLFGAAFQAPETRDLAWLWARTHFDAIAKRVPNEEAGALASIPSAFCDEKHRAEMEEFFLPRIGKIAGAPREYQQAMEGLDLCVARKKAQLPDVDAFLK